MSVNVAINGFGRIGRLVFRQLMERTDHDLNVVAINDIAPLDNLAYLLRHDSVQAKPDAEIVANDGSLRWANHEAEFLSVKDPAELPWADRDVDLVIEASGVFTGREDASKHLQAGADRVLITAPAKGPDLTVCMGINEDRYEPDQHAILSNASCTTNCLAPVAKALDEAFDIETGFLTTVHAVTASQAIVDAPHKKWRRGRSGMLNIVPTSTGAAVATTDVLPHLEGKLDGMAMRVPVGTGSIIDFVVQTAQPVGSESDVNDALRRAAETDQLRGILGVSDEELVSSDVIGSGYSSLVDSVMTMTLGDRTLKVLAWYDNEWGYASRVTDLANYIASKTPQRV